MNKIILPILTLIFFEGCSSLKINKIRNGKNAIATVVIPKLRTDSIKKGLYRPFSVINLKTYKEEKEYILPDTVCSSYIYWMLKAGNTLRIRYDSLNPKEIIINDYGNFIDNSPNGKFNLKRSKSSIITITKPFYSTHYRNIPELSYPISYKISLGGKDSIIHSIANVQLYFNVFKNIGDYIASSNNDAEYWDIHSGLNGDTIDRSLLKLMRNADLEMHTRTKGKDSISIVPDAVANRQYIMYMYKDTVSTYNMLYDSVDPGKIDIIASQPVLDDATEIDTAIAEVTEYYGYNEYSFGGIIRLDFMSKDSVEWGVFLPLDLWSKRNFIFWSCPYCTHPEIRKGTKLFVRFERRNPRKLYVIFNRPVDNNNSRFHVRRNYISTYLIPKTRLLVSYERPISYHNVLDLRLSYYYPSMPQIAPVDFTENETIYYKTGGVNRIDLGFKSYFSRASYGMYGEVFGSFARASNIPFKYFNHLSSLLSDSSITRYLAADPSNQVYTQKINFNTWGFGAGLGMRNFIFHGRIMLGFEFGLEYLYLPSYIQQSFISQGVTYQYTDFVNTNFSALDPIYINFTLTYCF